MEQIQQLMKAVNARYKWTLTLKPQQSEILTLLLGKKNVIGVLPTGFGKSLLYILPPLLLDQVNNIKHVALVVSPLRTLMNDQIRRCLEMGINAVMLSLRDEMTEDAKKGVTDGSVSIIFTSPEALASDYWLQKLKAYKERVCIVAFDEVHCISEWGSDFRPEYCNVLGIRSIFTDAPMIGLSGTVTEKVLRDVQLKMNLDDLDVIIKSMPPDRPNIFLDVVQQQSYDINCDLRWLIDNVRDNQCDQQKTIVFAQTLREVADIYETIMYHLGNHAYVNGRKDPAGRLISMYHGQISPSLQCYTLEEFNKPNSVIRVLICTIAFGMGVEIRDIREVILWGKCSSILSFWQQVGRCGRDGNPSRAVWYPTTVTGDDKEFFGKLKKDKTSCIRLAVLNAFIIPGMDTSLLTDLAVRQPCGNATQCHSGCTCSLCLCCSNCKKRCHCF